MAGRLAAKSGGCPPVDRPITAFTLGEAAPTGQLYAVSIGLVSLCIMFFYSKITNRVFRLIPAPMWVILLSLGFDAYFTLLGAGNPISKRLLISLPNDMLTTIPTPDFSKWKEPVFWGIVLSVTLVSSIESLLSIKTHKQVNSL